MYRAALLNTSKQITIASDGTAYVKTGDIPAEWLRDASAQVRPYLFFAKSDPQVARLLRGMIARMGKYLQIDPYANAFTLDYRVWEQKFELDSLAYPITLAWTYWKQTGDASIFTGDLSLGFDKALDDDGARARPPAQLAATRTARSRRRARATPSRYTGMIWTGFRPSDDACTYNYPDPLGDDGGRRARRARGDRARRLPQLHQSAARARAARRSADGDPDVRRRLHAELRLRLRLRSRRARQRRT